MFPGYRQTHPCGCEARLGTESIALAMCRVHAEAHRLLAVLQRTAKLVPAGTNLARDVEDALVEAGARCPSDAVTLPAACARRFRSKHDRPSVCTRPPGHAGDCAGNPVSDAPTPRVSWEG